MSDPLPCFVSVRPPEGIVIVPPSVREPLLVLIVPLPTATPVEVKATVLSVRSVVPELRLS